MSDFSSLLSSIIDQAYFEGVGVKKRVTILDLSCGCFSRHQGSVPDVPELDLGIGGGKKINKRSKATITFKNKRNKRNERNERNKSKIRNRIRNRSSRSRQTRKKKTN